MMQLLRIRRVQNRQDFKSPGPFPIQSFPAGWLIFRQKEVAMKSKKRIIFILLGVFVVLVIIRAMSSDSDSPSTASTSADSSQPAAKPDWADDSASGNNSADGDSDDPANSGGVSMAGSWGNSHSQEVADPELQMTAYTVAVPDGWTFEGDIVRGKDCRTAPVSLEYDMESPDGQIAIRRIHEMRWSYSTANNGGPCQSLNLTSAADFLVNIVVPSLHESAKVLEVLPPTPEGQQAIEAQQERDQEKQSAMGQIAGMPQSTATVDGARVHIAYEENGQEYEEVLMALVHCAHMPAEAFSCQSGGGETVIRAPRGKLNTLMADSGFQQMAGSVQDNPEWQERLATNGQQRFLQALRTYRANAQTLQWVASEDFRRRTQNSDTAFKAMMANSQAFNAAQADRFRRSQDNIQATEEATRQGAQRTVDFALDQRRYTSPYDGRTITASNEFNRVWAASDGSLAGTTGNADPNSVTAPGSPTFTQADPQD
jgi:hypothetical protein